MILRRLFLIAAGVFLIAGAYGCSGLGTGTGFQCGTEAGNPPTDGGFLGGTEAGNPPTGEQPGGTTGIDPNPREGDDLCDDPTTPEKEGPTCPDVDAHQKIDMLTPEQIGMLHDHQEQQEAAAEGAGLVNNLNPNMRHKLNEALGDFGHSETVMEPETNPSIALPPSSGSMTTILKNLK